MHWSSFGFKGEYAEGAVQYKTTFFASNILSCLNSVQKLLPEKAAAIPDFAKLRRRAAQFLLAQKSEQWSFNYWSSGAKERETMPYPDDLDDTFVVLAALYGYNASSTDGSVLAKVTKILTAAEVIPGGPYRTWLVDRNAKAAWRDIDLAVNSNVAYFLSLLGISLPNISRLVDERIREGSVRSPYYPGAIQVIYFISRFYKGNERQALADMLLVARVEGSARQNLLESAMAISALINLDRAEEISENDIAIMIERITKEGWQPYPFCIDPSRDGKTCYAGSRALTAAFCAEALAKYAHFKYQSNRLAAQIAAASGRVLLAESASDAILENIKLLARERIEKKFDDGDSQSDLRRLVFEQIESIKDEEIVLVPYHTYEALGKSHTVHANLLDELALANLYGWIACTIYDDLLDGEGESILLPVANFFLRELTFSYCALDRQIPGIRDEYIKTMNIVDGANVDEQLRGGTFESSIEHLADRSIGHALPALAVLSVAGYAPDSGEARHMLSFFRNYLIARQLHDDAHDWKEDLLRGQMNSAGGRLVRIFEEQHGVKVAPGELSGHIPEFQKLFWRQAILGIIADIKSFLNRAKDDLVKIDIFKNSVPFLQMVNRLESAADRTVRERATAIAFLGTFHFQK